MDPKDWTDNSIYKKGYTNILLRNYRNKKGIHEEWGMVHVTCFGKGASVLALTDRDEVVLERSLRIPLKSEVIELPGGLNDIEGESPLQVAQRELLEETGYAGGTYRAVAQLAEAPGITDQECVLFVAHGVHYVSSPTLGDSECITTLLIPRAEIRKFLEECGIPVDPKVYAALAFL